MQDNDFVKNGYRALPGFFDGDKTRALLKAALATRRVEDIFLDEATFRAEQKMRGVNPRPGRNLIEKLDTDFIFGDPRFQAEMARVCGPHWRVLDYKFVMGVPNALIPVWLQDELGDRLVANLGAYVQERYRDITYFRGIDFHQDIIDFPDRDSDFITVYLYLDDVGPNSSPLYLMPGTHRLGASVFPHKLEKQADGRYRYANDYGAKDTFDLMMLTGAAGSLYYWHASMLHGTQPHRDDTARLSVRILVEKNAKAISGSDVDQANAAIDGALSLTRTRLDLDETGKAVLAGNIINKN